MNLLKEKFLPKQVVAVFIMSAVMIFVPSVFTKLAAASSGELSVTLSQSTPASGGVEMGAADVTLAKFDLTATGGDVDISSIVVWSDSADAYFNFSNVKLIDSNNTQVGFTAGTLGYNSTTGITIATFTPSSPLRILSGTTETLDILANVYSSASGSIRFGIGSITAESVSSGSSVSVGETLPIYGNVMSI